MLRLAASAPLLWRTPTSVQLGVDAGIVLDDVEPWQEQLLAALTTGFPDAMLPALAATVGAATADARELVRSLAPVLESDPPGHASGTEAVLDIQSGVGAADARLIEDVVPATGIRLVSPGAGAAGSATRTSTAAHLIVASRIVDPHRAALLVSDDVTHLPVLLYGDVVRVGPCVIPGTTPCLACDHAYRRDADPAWPVVASQLLARRPLPTPPLLLVEAATIAARMLSGTIDPRTVSMLDARAVRSHLDETLPHPACWCRSPSRTGTAAAHGGPTSAPTTARGYAQPA